MERIDLGRGQIEYARVGVPDSRADIVFLHEGLGCTAMWGSFPHVLCVAASCRGLVYSRFGYGGSDRVARARTDRCMHDEALDVLPALLARLGMGAPVLVGQSDGASIALIYAAAHPGSVSGLILEAPHVFAETLTINAIARVRAQFAEDAVFRRKFGRYHADATSVVEDWSAAWLAPSFRAWTIEEGLEAITCPTLRRQAEGNPYGSLDHLHRIEARVTCPVRSVVLRGTGHAPHRDCHARTMTEMCAFLGHLVAQVPGGGR
jgi:pimeloyl-ACP methyl ester carboxylesterase